MEYIKRQHVLAFLISGCQNEHTILLYMQAKHLWFLHAWAKHQMPTDELAVLLCWAWQMPAVAVNGSSGPGGTLKKRPVSDILRLMCTTMTLLAYPILSLHSLPPAAAFLHLKCRCTSSQLQHHPPFSRWLHNCTRRLLPIFNHPPYHQQLRLLF